MKIHINIKQNRWFSTAFSVERKRGWDSVGKKVLDFYVRSNFLIEVGKFTHISDKVFAIRTKVHLTVLHLGKTNCTIVELSTVSTHP